MDTENTYTPSINETPIPEHIVGMGNKEDLKPVVDAIGEEQIKKAAEILQKYKQGKSNLENRIIENEEWWKLRHWNLQNDYTKHTPATAWLWNVITAKHADLEAGYPEPNVLPREEGDKAEAEMLTSILPVVIEQNGFKSTYSDACWDKLKYGCAIYGIFWDNQKYNGLGDITIKRVSPLNVFWEPGVTDIQDSMNFFHCELVDNALLKARYPQLKDIQIGGDKYVAKFLYDDTVDTSEKSTVVDWYYRKANPDGTKTLHYVKYCGDKVLYATENETIPPTKPMTDAYGQVVVNPNTGNMLSQAIGKSLAQEGIYQHGMYPFVFDSLYKAEGTPFGLGFTDILKDTQVTIDQLNAAIVRNAMMASKRRYFALDGLDINLEDFADWDKDIVPVSSQMTDETLKEITVSPLNDIYVSILNNQISMLKETSGNNDASQGIAPASVTSASGIAALQEAAGKTSADILSHTYEAYKKVIEQVIELIRQFYDLPRQFRIVGQYGAQKFVSYSNAGIKPQAQGVDFGINMGFRIPQFDLDITAQKATAYSKMSQNELMLQFYNLQFFNPQNATQALACLDGMDFDGKDTVIQKVQQNGTLLQVVTQVLQIAIGMAQAYDPNVIPELVAMGASVGAIDPNMAMPQQTTGSKAIDTDALGNDATEHPFVKKAREEANNASSVK